MVNTRRPKRVTTLKLEEMRKTASPRKIKKRPRPKAAQRPPLNQRSSGSGGSGKGRQLAKLITKPKAKTSSARGSFGRSKRSEKSPQYQPIDRSPGRVGPKRSLDLRASDTPTKPQHFNSKLSQPDNNKLHQVSAKVIQSGSKLPQLDTNLRKSPSCLNMGKMHSSTKLRKSHSVPKLRQYNMRRPGLMTPQFSPKLPQASPKHPKPAPSCMTSPPPAAPSRFDWSIGRGGRAVPVFNKEKLQKLLHKVAQSPSFGSNISAGPTSVPSNPVVANGTGSVPQPAVSSNESSQVAQSLKKSVVSPVDKGGDASKTSTAPRKRKRQQKSSKTCQSDKRARTVGVVSASPDIEIVFEQNSPEKAGTSKVVDGETTKGPRMSTMKERMLESLDLVRAKRKRKGTKEPPPPAQTDIIVATVAMPAPPTTECVTELQLSASSFKEKMKARLNATSYWKQTPMALSETPPSPSVAASTLTTNTKKCAVVTPVTRSPSVSLADESIKSVSSQLLKKKITERLKAVQSYQKPDVSLGGRKTDGTVTPGKKGLLSSGSSSVVGGHFGTNGGSLGNVRWRGVSLSATGPKVQRKSGPVVTNTTTVEQPFNPDKQIEQAVPIDLTNKLAQPATTPKIGSAVSGGVCLTSKQVPSHLTAAGLKQKLQARLTVAQSIPGTSATSTPVSASASDTDLDVVCLGMVQTPSSPILQRTKETDKMGTQPSSGSYRRPGNANQQPSTSPGNRPTKYVQQPLRSSGSDPAKSLPQLPTPSVGRPAKLVQSPSTSSGSRSTAANPKPCTFSGSSPTSSAQQPFTSSVTTITRKSGTLFEKFRGGDAVNPATTQPTQVTRSRGAIESAPATSGRGKTKSQLATQSLTARMTERLKGARFRHINESLYTISGKDAVKFFVDDPEAFQVYHEGYHSQMSKWPVHPLDLIIENIQRMPKSVVIADFGCGDAKLARSVPHKVHSFDLVALNEHVVACNMEKVPLANESVNLVVFCLSLMGTSLTAYLKEANRVLKMGGLLKIAEVESRFNDVPHFAGAIRDLGFSFLSKNTDHKMFVIMNCVKIKNCPAKPATNVILKPCLYKRRWRTNMSAIGGSRKNDPSSNHWHFSLITADAGFKSAPASSKQVSTIAAKIVPARFQNTQKRRTN